MDVSIITVTWNSEKYILEQIESVKKGAEGLVFEQFIADNNSDDRTVDVIKKNNPDIFLRSFTYNSGFAYANNRLFEKSSGKYILLLNPDLQVFPGSIKKIFDFAEQHEKAGIVGGRLLDADGKGKVNALPRRFPTIFDQLVILLKLHHIFPFLLDRYLRKDFDASIAQQVDSVQGAFMMIRRDLCVQIGRLFDERYYIWFEDVDLCREAIKHGFEVWYAPIDSAKDYGGRSFAKQSLLWKQMNFFRSMYKYFKKWGFGS